MFQDLPHTDSGGLARFAEKNARLLDALADRSGSILIVEPGLPRSGEFIAFMREALVNLGRNPASPCPCGEGGIPWGPCPFPGGKAAGTQGVANNKWCHFAFETADASAPLLALSKAAGLPKERATLSFLLTFSGGQDRGHAPRRGAVAAEILAAAENTAPDSTKIFVRIISDPFPVGQGGTGRYACSARGLVLVTGTRAEMEKMNSGALAEFKLPNTESRDGKSGALIIRAVKNTHENL
jgi:hypothetical protein